MSFTEEDIIGIVRKHGEDRIVWLEYGNIITGLLHIIDDHLNQFKKKLGLEDTQEVAQEVAKIILEKVSTATVYDYKPDKDLYIYQVGDWLIGIVISDNGYIVSAFPYTP